MVVDSNPSFHIHKPHSMNKRKITIIFFLLVNLFSVRLHGADQDLLDEQIIELMEEGDIPGLSLVTINKGKVFIKNFGYSDVSTGKKINENTLFEIGSNSKAFTALAMLKLADENQLNLDQPVTDFLPWFLPSFEGQTVPVTLRQLLHHTSGIPTYTISLIPEGDQQDALEQTVRTVKDIELESMPGQRFQYATINYDILGLILEKVTKSSFEEYLEQTIFKDLGLNNTYLNRDNPAVSEHLSEGYKIGFFEPRKYDAPIFRGNNPAGYVISNADDIAKWLAYQMGLERVEYDSLIMESHQRDNTVLPQNLSSYAYGWYVSLSGNGEISHSGLNPNFTSHIAFIKDKGIGVAILANSNSNYTAVIAERVLETMNGAEMNTSINMEDPMDKQFSILSMILAFYVLCVLVVFGFIIYRIIIGQRQFESFSLRKFLNVIIVMASFVPFLYGLYLLPYAIVNFNWEAILVWAPISFQGLILLSLIAMAATLMVYVVSLFFPDKNEYIQSAPKVILLSVLSGLANTVVVLLITSSINSAIEIKYLLYYFGLAAMIYLIGRKVVQTDMVYITRNIIYNLRLKMTSKIFSTSYENFEKIDRGRIYSIMDYDIGTLGQAAATFITIVTSIITALGVFFYMATLSFWATILTILLIVVITFVYNQATAKTNVLFNDARQTHTIYMRLLNGMIDGFRQLSIHRNKKLAYKDEIGRTTDEYRNKINTANIKFINAFLIGESLLLVVLAVVAFAMPRVFADISSQVIMSFIILLLYLIGPINSILNSIPQLVQFKVSYNRIQEFIKEIPASIDLSKVMAPDKSAKNSVDSISIRSLSYQYPEKEGQYAFSVGPINLSAQKGEIIFIIGGNGSGKTTFSKLLTGLYTSHDGEILINDKKVAFSDIGEYFSTVFHPLFIFRKLYDVQEDENSDWTELLDLLELKDKVDILRGNTFSTLNLSGGQRKRLALLQCFMEDKPIYLFDEWAADQDPEYRRTFYRELLPKMKEQGKIVFAITHDDHYFDIADKVIKLEMGKVDYVKENEPITA